jgi:ribosome biogenesis GTPase / thiamine phosphate phosphatase
LNRTRAQRRDAPETAAARPDIPSEGLGLVVAAHGRHAMVETPSGERVLCHARGKRNEVVVGDRVHWQRSGDGGVVDRVEPRRNLLFRQDEWRTKSFAANVDRMLVVVAVDPMFGESQLARALIAAAEARIPAALLLNKVDLAGADAARDRLAPYRAMGVEVIECALKADPAGARERLLPELEGRHTLVLGPSGAGKSTLINLLVPGAAAQVGELSAALATGRHTTTTTRWYWLDGERRGALIDSPGFQEFGLRQVDAPALASLMPDFAAHLGTCRFHNCSHRQEPGCAVRAALDAGQISPSRYRIYGELFDELSRTRW